jgi:hypothetical protein
LRDIVSFRSFLSKRFTSEDLNILIGYKHLVEWVLRSYLFDFELADFLGLTLDRASARAFWVGPPRVPYEKIPPTCEKTVAARNLNEVFTDILRSQDFASLEANMEILHRTFLKPLSRTFEKHVGVYRRLSKLGDKHAMLIDVGLTQFWNHAQNIGRIAHLDFQPETANSRIEKNRKHLEHYFLGYKLGLAYVWETLRREEAKEYVDRILASETWENLALVCNSMSDYVADLGENLHAGKIFVRKGKPDKRLLVGILRPPQAVEMSPHEKLDAMLLWYDNLEIIDSARSKLFSGGPTFRSLLHGEVLNRVRHGTREKLRVIRFKHPSSPSWFSYAILMEWRGTISDSSGWLIFLEVGGDYSGQGGLEYSLAESMLKQLKKWVLVSDFEIALESLWEFYHDKIEKAVKSSLGGASDTELMRFRLNEFERLAPHVLGRMLEFTVKEFYMLSYPEVHLRFKDAQVMRDNKEVDVLAIRRDTRDLAVTECKTSIPVHDLDSLIESINFKAECVQRSSRFKGFDHIEKVFVTTMKGVAETRSFETVLQKLHAANIRLLVLERDILPRLPRGFKREELLEIFRLGIRNFYDFE